MIFSNVLGAVDSFAIGASNHLHMLAGNVLDGGTSGGGTGGGDLDVGGLLKGAQTDKGAAALGGLEGKTKELGTSGYRIIFMAMTFLFIIGLVAAFLKLFFSNSQTRNDSKSDIIWKVIAVICGFGVIALVLFLSGVGTNLFG